MAASKQKSVPTSVPSPPRSAVTLTIPVPAPRNRLAVSPLLKKSFVHASSRKRERNAHDHDED